MKCENCKHLTAIRRALAPCQGCDAGRLHGQIRANGDVADWAVAKIGRADEQPDPTGQTAPYESASDEHNAADYRRVITAELFQLDEIQLLLTRWITKGGTYATFPDTLLHLADRITGYQFVRHPNTGRALVGNWADAIRSRFPKLASVFYRGKGGGR